MVVVALALTLLAGLIFWVAYVCWHSATVVREAVLLPRRERIHRLAKWVFRSVLSGAMLYPLSSAPSALVPSGGALVRQAGERICIGGILIATIALLAAIVVTMRAPEPPASSIVSGDRQYG
ncbi:MAG: hypothetical protein CVT66_10275 [Actinobacteria bacterium HGW-Actinobacteria-6]|jgi:hypothetical protein|nr:MAG: hypothetical protein CVT66_10275 [Actinobacteria bacterium HGW-Actinobacteria-6]